MRTITSRSFAKGRKVENGGMNRLYAVESLFTLTGANADHRLRVAASLVAKLLPVGVGCNVPGQTGVGSQPKCRSTTNWVSECAKDLVANRGKVLVVAGQRQPIEVHLLAHAINSALGAIGNTVTLIPATADSHRRGSGSDLDAHD